MTNEVNVDIIHDVFVKGCVNENNNEIKSDSSNQEVETGKPALVPVKTCNNEEIE